MIEPLKPLEDLDIKDAIVCLTSKLNEVIDVVDKLEFKLNSLISEKTQFRTPDTPKPEGHEEEG